MAILVLCANLLVAAFLLAYAVEIFCLVVGSIVYAYKALPNKRASFTKK